MAFGADGAGDVVDAGNPQLLIKGIESMSINYFYTEGCPETFEESETASASAPTPTPAGNAQKQEDKTKDETFKYTTTLSGDETPASIELLLNSGSINAGGSNDENKVQLYQINATVRGGNKCTFLPVPHLGVSAAGSSSRNVCLCAADFGASQSA